MGCRDSSFAVHKGQFVGITGKSDAGKTTVLKCIYRTYLPSGGSILFNSKLGAEIDLAQCTEQQVIAVRRQELDSEAYLSQEKMRAIWQNMQKYPDYKVYVMLSNDKIVGTFSLLIGDNLAHSGASFAVLDNMVVNPDCRRQGIGKKMILKAMELARQKQCYKIMLSSNKNRVQAHEFYQKLGFEQHGISFIVR